MQIKFYEEKSSKNAKKYLPKTNNISPTNMKEFATLQSTNK